MSCVRYFLSKGLWFFLLLWSQELNAWTTSHRRPFHHRGNPALTMDTEGPMIPFVSPSFLRKTKNELITTRRRWRENNMNINTRYGMPWQSSIGANDGADCVYMPFWEWQLSYFEEHLTNFRVLPMNDSSLEYAVSPAANHTHTHNHNHNHAPTTHRMVTLVGSSDEYRYIRMTYMDGGAKSQIFTSVCYPRGNLPILGIDLLQFAGGKRHLAIVDFQPLHKEGESHHDASYEHLLEPIRQAVPSLQEPMTDRFYDPDLYFSKQTLLGRFQSTHTIWQDLWPAYQAYVQTHVQLMQQTKKGSSSQTSTLSATEVLKRHAAYDTYVASRDPAHPMFASLFGSDFANNFMYQVLFPLAERKEPDEASK